MVEPWVHIVWNIQSQKQLNTFLSNRYSCAKLMPILDGSMVNTLEDFYKRIEIAIPLIDGFGSNLDALIDLFRTFGWGNYAGKKHVFSWLYPEVMYYESPKDFFDVVDVIVGVSKELLVGEELNDDFAPINTEEWLSTRLDLVFACRDGRAVSEIKKAASRLSDSWAGDFKSLDIPVEEISI